MKETTPPPMVVTPEDTIRDGLSLKALRMANPKLGKPACRKHILPIIASNLREAIHDRVGDCLQATSNPAITSYSVDVFV